MAWYDEDSWLTAAFAPKLSAILVSCLVALLVPVLLHHFIYRKATPTAQPTFLLVGPSSGGKTAFLTLADRNTVAQTHTSTTPSTLEITLPESFVPASSSFRSPGDPALERARRFVLIDTPGHAKLRRFATALLAKPAANVRGVIFVVDAAAVAEDAGLHVAAEYLHDVLLALQKRVSSGKAKDGIPVLIAANKLDLFTALPPHLVRVQLEKAVGEVRRTRAKGLREASSSSAVEGADDDEEVEWLGEGGEGAFAFAQMDEVGTSVDVLGGNLVGGKGPDAREWFGWVAEQL